MRQQIASIFFLILIIFLNSCRVKQRKEPEQKTIQITDMAGRKVFVPAHISSVFGADFTTTFAIQAIAPELLAAWNTGPSNSEKEFLPDKLNSLPVLGMIFYGRSSLNIEDLARIHPDVILCPLFQHTTTEYIANYEEYGKKTGAAVVMVALDFDRLPEAFHFLGKLVNKEDSGEALSDYSKETLEWATSVRLQIKDTISIYVAEGLSGLQTIPAGSTHSQIFNVAGIQNCAFIDEDFGYKDISINIEQLIKWNPDYILVNSRMSNQNGNILLEKLKNDKSWQMLDAVKNNHLLLVPTTPKNWIGRPPGMNRLLGIRWLIANLYPEIATVDMPEEVSRFCELFYHFSPSEEQINRMLNEK